MSYPVLKELRDTTSTNEKQVILEKHKDDLLFKKVLYYTYNPLFNFYVKKFKKYKSGILYIEDDMFNVLDKLRKREVTGNSAVALVEDMYEHLSEENRELFDLILKRDLKAGINKKLINKVYGDLIPVIPYMGAIAFDEKKVTKLFKDFDEVISEIKYDGMFINIIKEGNDIYTLSRSGKDLALENIFKNIEIKNDYVFTGELLVEGFNRYIANGMLNSYSTIQKKLKENSKEKLLKDLEKFETRYKIGFEEVEKRIYVMAWDIIPLADWKKGKCNLTLLQRKEILLDVSSNISKINPVKFKIIENEIEAKKEFIKRKNEGEEGIILKGISAPYKDGKPNFQIKYKIIMDVDLVMKGFEFGNPGTKYENVINRVICESQDGIVKTQVSGFTEADMDFFTSNKEKLIGKIATIECSGLSQDKEGNFSLLHPRFIEVREDKTTGDDLQKIKEIEKMVTELSD